MSVGGGIVMSATRGERSRPAASPPPLLAPAFYAARRGGWRDYWTLLHPPYTLWHLSFVVMGAAIAPSPDPKIVAGALVAFGLAVGVAAHAFDELNGRPLRTQIPSPVLVGLGSGALLGAVAIGVMGATMFGPLFLALVAGGAALVVLYAFEAPFVHTDVGFAVGWGGFPVVATAFATGAHVGTGSAGRLRGDCCSAWRSGGSPHARARFAGERWRSAARSSTPTVRQRRSTLVASSAPRRALCRSCGSHSWRPRWRCCWPTGSELSD